MRRGLTRRRFALTAASAALGCRRRPPAAAPSDVIEVDARAPEGPLNRLSGVQGSPHPIVDGDVDRRALFREHGIEHARIDQDCAPNTLTLGGVFPDEDADPERPESYRFAAIDRHLAAAKEAGASVLWQAGYDVGGSDRWVGPNLGGRPPRDVERWTRVVTRCLEHFNFGWAGGLDRAVAAVEFLNEPDGLGGFHGADAPRLLPTFTAFLDAIARFNGAHPGAAVSAVGPGIPLSLAEWPEWRARFQAALARLREGGQRLDAFSFHTYGDDLAPASNAALARELRGLLDAEGMRSTELWNSEWLAGDFLRRHLDLDARQVLTSSLDERRRYAAAMAAYALACKLRWQGVVDRSYYYRINQRAHPPGRSDPFPGEGSFLASATRPGALALHEGLMRRAAEATPLRVRTTHDDDGLVSALGLRSKDGEVVGVLLSNLRPINAALTLVLRGEGPAAVRASAAILDARADLEPRPLASRRDGDLALVEIEVEALSSALVLARRA